VRSNGTQIGIDSLAPPSSGCPAVRLWLTIGSGKVLSFQKLYKHNNRFYSPILLAHVSDLLLSPTPNAIGQQQYYYPTQYGLPSL
jgi:hypothetical protein